VNRSCGQLLLIGLLLAVLSYNMSRAFFQQGDRPVFLSEKAQMLLVELGSGFPEPSIHQFIDGIRCADVIKLTVGGRTTIGSDVNGLNAPVRSGEKISIDVKNDIIKGVRVSWMSAAKRIALGIPLHPDRMSLEDWQVLPGIGISLARKIEHDRQKNGEFGVFSALTRVQGIGERRLSSWNQYFFKD